MHQAAHITCRDCACLQSSAGQVSEPLVVCSSLHLVDTGVTEISAAARHQLPDGTGNTAIDFTREVQHACKTGKGFLAFVIVIAEANAQLISDRSLLHAADEDIDVLLL